MNERDQQVWTAMRFPKEPSLCWDVKVRWVPVREIDPATGRPHTEGPSGTTPAPTQE